MGSTAQTSAAQQTTVARQNHGTTAFNAPKILMPAYKGGAPSNIHPLKKVQMGHTVAPKGRIDYKQVFGGVKLQRPNTSRLAVTATLGPIQEEGAQIKTFKLSSNVYSRAQLTQSKQTPKYNRMSVVVRGSNQQNLGSADLSALQHSVYAKLSQPQPQPEAVPFVYINSPSQHLKTDYLQKILTSRVYDVAIESPLDEAVKLSNKLNRKVFLKRDDLQPVKSFKIRGAYNKMAKCTKEELERGLICASAGNHAQGVAMSSQILNCKAIIVMPKTTPDIKVNAVKARGGNVVLHGDSFQEANAYALKQSEEEGLVFIPPYDDPEVIAGQGTIGMEILRQNANVNAIFIPIGGGGLIAGVAAYIKAVNPKIKIIGVETEDANAMYQSLKADKRVTLDKVGLFADGTAVKQVGEYTFEVCRQFVDEVVLVSTDELCAAIKDIFEDTRAIVEPSGALGVAGLKKYVQRGSGEESDVLVAINSGANMNFDRLRYVSERAQIGEKREAVIAVTIPEEPGSFKKLRKLIGLDRNVTEFNYRYSDKQNAHVYCAFEISSLEEVDKLVETLKESGYPTLDLTQNEVAKLHIRHLMGGHHPDNGKIEKILRFQFPEMPGASINFLEILSGNGDFNISLFHYRNHGSDMGRVLIGFQMQPDQTEQFNKFLETLGYDYVDETLDPAIALFLK